MKLGLVSLGCDKNTVDSERMLAALVGHGARRVADLREADVVVVNTCGFIDAAKEESLETLLEAAALKAESGVRAVLAVGCMVERYREEMEAALPEVDLFFGLRDLDRMIPELRRRGLLGDPLADHPGARLPLSGHRHVAYLKVSEGCNHGCAFCAIPLWRGRHRSFEVDRLVAEARRLEAQGTVELNLVAQDLAHFGRDLRDGTDLVTLLRDVLSETTIPWIRLLYIYSAGIREPLLKLMAREPRLLPYLDMPIQHASDPVLERMRRPERRETLRRKIGWIRSAVPGVTLRTTVMVGFPGETEADFRRLLDFLEEVRFERLGAFAFSPQDGTRAAGQTDLFVPEDVARARLEELLEVQRAVSADGMAREVGGLRTVLVDRSGGWEGGTEPGGAERWSDGAFPGSGRSFRNGGAGHRFMGRTAAQAHDVDGETLLLSREPLRPGALVEAEVVAAGDYDLAAEVRRVVRWPASGRRAPEGRTGRAGGMQGRAASSRPLPIAPLGLETVWGK